MKLHLDKDAFAVLIESIGRKTGYRLDVLEKDYYVVLLLQELSQMQRDGLPAYFKGGTALYKALRATNRFSEDIDLSVDLTGCSRTQGDKRLEKATKKYASLPRNPAEGKTNRSEIIAIYNYDPIVEYDENDALQRFRRVKIEATSFTISEPTFDMKVSAMIYDYATDEQKQILRGQYEVEPFFVKTITIERVFVDKLFAAEAYVRKSSDPKRAFEAAKHIYDLAVISCHPQILSLMKNNEMLKWLLDIRTEEELRRLDGIPSILPCQFVFFQRAAFDRNVKSAYETMQNQYVLRPSDRIEFEEAIEALHKLEAELLQNEVWVKYSNALLSIEKEKSDDLDER